MFPRLALALALSGLAPDQPEGLYTATYDVIVWYN